MAGGGGGAGGAAGVYHNPAVKGQLAPEMQSRRDKSQEFKPNPQTLHQRPAGVKSPCKELQADQEHQVHAGRSTGSKTA